MIATGYILMSIMTGCIMCLWLYEWLKMEAIETKDCQIRGFRQDIFYIYERMAGLSILGETLLEWKNEDLEHYHALRMEIDSILCRFQTKFPTERIDSVRYLLEDK